MFEKYLPSWYSSINFLITNIDGIRNLNSLKVHKFKVVYSKSVYLNITCFSCFTTFKQYFGQEKILKIIKKIEHAGVVLHVFAYLPTDLI